jgi:ribosomal protein L17
LNFCRYIVQNDLLGPIFDLFVKNGKRNNMINSAILQLVEYVSIENTANHAQLVRYIAEKYVIPLKLDQLQYVSTFQTLLKRYHAVTNPSNPMITNTLNKNNSNNVNNKSSPPTNINNNNAQSKPGNQTSVPRGARKPPPGVRSDVDEDEAFFSFTALLGDQDEYQEMMPKSSSTSSKSSFVTAKGNANQKDHVTDVTDLNNDAGGGKRPLDLASQQDNAPKRQKVEDGESDNAE